MSDSHPSLQLSQTRRVSTRRAMGDSVWSVRVLMGGGLHACLPGDLDLYYFVLFPRVKQGYNHYSLVSESTSVAMTNIFKKFSLKYDSFLKFKHSLEHKAVYI